MAIMSNSVAYILQHQETIVAGIPPGGGGSRVYSHVNVYKRLVLVSSHFQNKHEHLSTWVKVQNFQNPELLKFKFSNLQVVYKNG